MASSLVQWEADPFFPAAEEVQNSADRMESAFRTWRHVNALGVCSDASIHTLRLELITTLDTVKWQIEEFERTVEASATIESPHFSKEASSRHRYFVKAIRRQVSYADKVLEEARGQYKSQAMCVHSKQEDTDSLVDFVSGRLFETSAGSDVGHSSDCQLKNDCTVRGSLAVNERVECGNSKLVSPGSKKTPNSSSTSAERYFFKAEAKDNLINQQEDKGNGTMLLQDLESARKNPFDQDNLINQQEDKGNRTMLLQDLENVRQKPSDHLGKFSTVSYGCETSLSSCAPDIWTSAGVSLEIVNDSTEAEQTSQGIHMLEGTKNMGSHISTSDLKDWKDTRNNCMEHPDKFSPFAVIQILKGVSVSDLEQGPRIRPGNYQKVPTDFDASKLESFEKDRTVACRKAFQLRLWMLHRITHGRVLQLVSALLIVISIVGISVL